jgi:acyl-CoA reductase-like NAD-dependent aldehyde dehydrogenase
MEKTEAQTSAATPRSFQTVNPATSRNGKLHRGNTIDEALTIAADVHQAQTAWRRAPFAERASSMKDAAKVIRNNRERFAKLMTDEMGKPVSDGLAELEKCAWSCEYFAEMAEELLKPIPLDMSAGERPLPRPDRESSRAKREEWCRGAPRQRGADAGGRLVSGDGPVERSPWAGRA